MGDDLIGRTHRTSPGLPVISDGMKGQCAESNEEFTFFTQSLNDQSVGFAKSKSGTAEARVQRVRWKAALSPDEKRLTEHLSAFANQPGGGFLVFGVDSTGTAIGVDERTIETVA